MIIVLKVIFIVQIFNTSVLFLCEKIVESGGTFGNSLYLFVGIYKI